MPGRAIEFGDISTGFGTELSSQSTWYIVDAVQPPNVTANTVLISSPKQNVVQKFQNSNALTLYMPTWSKQEMTLAGQLGLASSLDRLQVSSECIKELFNLFGGIPRYVFEGRKGNLKNLKREVETAAKDAAKFLTDWVMQLISDSGNPNLTSHKVVQIIPLTEEGPTRYYRLKLDFVSPEVERIVKAHMTALQEADLLSFLNRSAQFTSFATFAGALFEQRVHNILPKGGKFKIRKLIPGPVPAENELLELEKSSMTATFDKLEDVILQRNAYWVPASKTNEAFDSLKPPNMIFQITIANKHSVSKIHIMNAAETLCPLRDGGGENHEIRLYFVVPMRLFKAYKRQSYLNDKNRVETGKNNHVAGVEQYVLGVKLEALEPLNPKKRWSL